MAYNMIRHFNISLKELDFLELDFIYDMMKFFNKEEKSREFLQMALAGVDLKKSSEYRRFISEEIEDIEVDMTDMEGIKEMSMNILSEKR